MRFRELGTIGSASLVAAITACIAVILSWHLALVLAGPGAVPGAVPRSLHPSVIIVAAGSVGALAVLFILMMIVIAKEAVARDIRGLGALVRKGTAFADPDLVNLGTLNRRRRDESLFTRAFADALSDHREIERRLSLIIDNIGEGVITIDDRGNIGSFNPACEKIFGWAAETVIGENVNLLMPPEQGKAHDAYLRRYLKTGTRHFDWSGRIERALRADGTEFPIELTVTQITISNRLVYVGIIRDVAEREAAEKAKAEFLATVSHELRTPLTSIRGALGVLQAGAVRDDEAKVQRLMSVALQNSERLGRLIDSILDMEKLDAGKLELRKDRLDLCQLVGEALEAFGGYAQEYGVSFEVADRCHDIFVFGDRERLMQVMANLLSNAAKFSSAGGTVRVSGRYDAAARRVRVEVEDHGCGIPEGAQPTVFEKFTQADTTDRRRRGGTGLGLGIARKIIEMHGGLIDFVSQVGRGTTFFFELPVATDLDQGGPDQAGPSRTGTARA